MIVLWRKRRRPDRQFLGPFALLSVARCPTIRLAKHQASYPLIIVPRSRPSLSAICASTTAGSRRSSEACRRRGPNWGRCRRHKRPSSNANRLSRYTPAPKCQEIVRASCSSVRSWREQCQRNSATLAPQCVCGRGPSGSCPVRAAPQSLSRAGNTGTALNASRPLRRSMIHSRQASL
jgi:hypothetical protein